MYECTICLSLNHASRLHCQNCGAVPAMYSITGYVEQSVTDGSPYSHIEVVAAHGCQRASEHKGQRVYLRTVPLDYYAS